MRPSTPFALVFLLPIVLLGACSSSEDDSKPATVSPEDLDAACAHYAEVSCAKSASCSAYHVPFRYPSEATCLASEAAYCRKPFERTGTNASLEWLAGCTAAVETTVCNRLDYYIPDACRGVPGTFPDGQECVDHDQCASGNCVFEHLCGTCGPPPQRLEDGAACGSTTPDCQLGSFCIDDTCTHVPDLGEACSAELGCAGGLGCIDGICGAPRAEGAACAYDNDCQFGFACEGGSCVSSPPASTLGMPCVGGSVDPSQRCAGAEYCSAPGYGQPGICKAQLNEGEPCTDAPLLDSCFVTFDCIDGVCSRLPTLSACLP